MKKTATTTAARNKIYIYATQPSGQLNPTDHVVGSVEEKNYYRVMTEKHGKLFFHSDSDYQKWSQNGRNAQAPSRRSTMVGRRATNHHQTQSVAVAGAAYDEDEA